MKKFLIYWDTWYDTKFCIKKANSKEEAIEFASKEAAKEEKYNIWEGFIVTELPDDDTVYLENLTLH